MSAPRIKGGLDRIPVGSKHDGRRRITDDQKLQMKKLYEMGKSIHEITRIVGCSRRSVQYVIFPERLAIVKQQAKEAKRWEPYNTKDIRREVMRKYRAKKRALLAEGKITPIK